MGLDIVSFSKIEKIEKDVDPEEYDMPDDEAWLAPYTDDGDDESAEFASRAEGIHGLYRVDEPLVVDAGSYSGYNAWREWLCQWALGVGCDEVWDNPDKYFDKPFYELINFADNEGLIGPKTSAKLAADFERERARMPEDAAEFEETYDGMAEAFANAAKGGCVVFA